MKKNSPYTKIAIFLCVCALSVGVVRAAWTDGGTFPLNNIPTPVHTGANVGMIAGIGGVGQVKQQGLSVDTFSTTKNAQFFQQTFLRGLVRGGAIGDPSSTLNIGSANPSDTHVVNTSVSGKLAVTGTVGATTLANSSNQYVCADTTGKLILCPAAVQYGTVEVANVSDYVDPTAVVKIGTIVTQITATFGNVGSMQVPVGTYSFIASCRITAPDTVTRVLNATPSPRTVTVTSGGTANITVKCDCQPRNGTSGECRL